MKKIMTMGIWCLTLPLGAQLALLQTGEITDLANAILKDGLYTHKRSSDAPALPDIKLSDIILVKHSRPGKLTEAQKLWSEGKAAQAETLLAELEPIYEPLGETPGNLWAEIVFLRLEALQLLGDDNKVARLLADLEPRITTPSSRLQLRLFHLQRKVRVQSVEEVLKETQQIQNECVYSKDKALIEQILGDLALRSGKLTEAMSHYHRVSALFGGQFPQAPQARISLAGCHLKLGQTSQARAILRTLATDWPNSPQAASAAEELNKLDYPSTEARSQKVLGLPPI